MFEKIRNEAYGGTRFSAGSILLIPHTFKNTKFLGLVVDQKAAQACINKNPGGEQRPKDFEDGGVTIVLLLGEKRIGKVLRTPVRQVGTHEKGDLPRFLYARNSDVEVFCRSEAHALKIWQQTLEKVMLLSDNQFELEQVLRDLRVIVTYRYGEVQTGDTYEKEYYEMLEELLPKLEGEISEG